MQPYLLQPLLPIMKKQWPILHILLFLSASSCAQPVQQAVSTDPSAAIAFPGAEGFGKFTSGGRGGQVMIVNTLADDGEGSLRKAVNTKGAKIIVFSVSGTIHLNSPLSIKTNTTIAGQTAPGDGICLADYPVSLGGDNIIIRYMRFRMGDRFQSQKGMVDGSGGDDAFGGMKRKNIIIDHCSVSWSTDEVFSVYAGDSTTLQWNIISEPLNYSYHFETGDKDWEHHGFGGIWGGLHLSAHHNLIAHCANRCPRFNGIRHTPTELVDYRNNVIYNWGSNNIYAGEGGSYNIVNNYFKYGPSTNKNVRYRICNPGKRDPDIGFGSWHVSGNYVDESRPVTNDNWLGVDMGNGGTEEDKKKFVIKEAHPAEALPVEAATTSYETVLQSAGASFRRDTLDQRIVNDVRNRTGQFIDVQGGFPHGTAYELTVNAWPALRSAPAPADTDKDGMPDAWEKEKGLNPADPADATKTGLLSYYTNIEVYINSLVK